MRTQCCDETCDIDKSYPSHRTRSARRNTEHGIPHSSAEHEILSDLTTHANHPSDPHQKNSQIPGFGHSNCLFRCLEPAVSSSTEFAPEHSELPVFKRKLNLTNLRIVSSGRRTHARGLCGLCETPPLGLGVDKLHRGSTVTCRRDARHVSKRNG